MSGNLVEHEGVGTGKFVATFAVIMCGLLAVPSMAQDTPACNFVHRDGWALLFAAPEHWLAVCPVDEQVDVALWPNGSSWADASGVMYAKVSTEPKSSLTEYADGDLRDFGEQVPDLAIHVMNSLTLADGSQALVRALASKNGDVNELIGYGKLDTAYVLVALSCRSQAILERMRPAFEKLIASIRPVKVIP